MNVTVSYSYIIMYVIFKLARTMLTENMTGIASYRLTAYTLIIFVATYRTGYRPARANRMRPLNRKTP